MHDALFKASFGQPDVARSELELVLPRAVLAHLDTSTLAVSPTSVVDEELRSTHSDLLFSVRTRAVTGSGGEALVYVLFEHQSSFDETMPLRPLNYVVRLWVQWLRDHPGTSTLPIILPVLLRHGGGGGGEESKAWKAEPTLASMLDASPELLAAARPFLPLFGFVLDDLAALSLETLASRTLVCDLRFPASAQFQREASPRIFRWPFRRIDPIQLVQNAARRGAARGRLAGASDS